MADSKKSKSSKATSKISYKSEPSALVVPSYEGTDPKTIIFPEWSDQEYNAEKWDVAKDKLRKGKTSSMTSSEGESSKAAVKSSGPGYFRDPHSYTLPETVSAYKWKKPEALFPNKTLVVYKESSLHSYADLISGSKHLLATEFYRVFISYIHSLEYLGYNDPWPIEGVSQTYTPNTGDEPWKPWHHIYAVCKAGKGQKHKPQVNKLGKYAIRLYWLGCWRRIMVDDFLPVDQMDHILLPTSQVPLATRPPQKSADAEQLLDFQSAQKTDKNAEKKGGKKEKSNIGAREEQTGDENDNEIELWPFLLCKGLLKIANLTWAPNKQLVDFNIVHSLTGLNPLDMWDICVAYTDHFYWPGEGKLSEKESKEEIKADKSTKSSKDTNKSKKKDNNLEDSNKCLPFCLFGCISDTRTMNPDYIPEISPCWSHYFLVQQTRTIPLEKPPERPKLARWKRFRWVEWAKSHGIYLEDDDETYKFFKLVSNFKKIADLVVYDIPSYFDLFQREPLQKQDDPKELIEASKKDKDMKSSDSTKVTKSSPPKSSKKSNEERAFEKPPDPSFWMDFNNISQFVTKLHIYLKPSQFPTKITITDLAEKRGKPQKAEKKPKDKAADKIDKKIIWPNDLKTIGNEHLYMFTDGLDYKFLAVCFSTAGNENILKQKCLTVHNDLHSLWQKKIDYHQRSKMRICANLLLENYDWRLLCESGEFLSSIETLGTKTAILLLPPGRSFLKLMINCPTSYVITVLCDVPLYLGTSEYVLECLPSESHRLLLKCFNLGADFGRLVQSFGMVNYKEAILKFYSSYKSGKENLCKEECNLVHQEFFKELERIIKEKYPDCGEVMFALRVLFLNPEMGFNCPPRKTKQKKVKKEKKEKKKQQQEEVIVWDDDECLSSVEEVEISHSEGPTLDQIEDIAARKIQSVFQRIYVEKLKTYHNMEHPQYMKIFEILKKVYKDIFSVDKRVYYFSQVFRNLLMKNFSMSAISNKYDIYNDLASVISTQIFSGNLIFGTEPWTPLARYEFFVNSPVPEPVRISLYSTASRNILRVFNNDTKEEMYRVLNNVLVHQYETNERGYTVLAYGWNDPGKIVWKLVFYYINKSLNGPLIIPEKQVQLQKLCDVYHANVFDTIAKCLVAIGKDTNISIRFSCSWDEVKLKLVCKDNDGKVLDEITGQKTIILPLVQLKYRPLEIREQSISNLSRIGSRTSTTKQSSTSAFGSKLKARRSSDKGSTTGSLTSRKSNRNSVSSPPQPPPNDSFYVVEAHILQHSWPLTLDEWIESEKVKRRNLIGPSLTGSRKSIGCLRQRVSADYSTLPNPCWCLQTVCDKADAIALVFDKRRDQEIRHIKLKWFEQKDRYERSQFLREQYLESFSIARKSASDFAIPDELSNEDQSTKEMWEILGEESVELNTNSMCNAEDVEQRFTMKPVLSQMAKLPPLDYTLFAYHEKLEPEKINWFQSKDDVQEQQDMADSHRQRLNNSYPGTSLLTEDLETSTDLIDLELEAETIEDFTDSDDECYLKKAEDYDGDMENMYKAVEEFEREYAGFIEEMNALRERSLKKGHVLQQWFEDVRDESIGLLEHSYALRRKYLERLEAEDRERKSLESAEMDSRKSKKSGSKDSKSSKSPKKK